MPLQESRGWVEPGVRAALNSPWSGAGEVERDCSLQRVAALYAQKTRSSLRGAVAQLGERLNGIQEVEGSIPFSSTILLSIASSA